MERREWGRAEGEIFYHHRCGGVKGKSDFPPPLEYPHPMDLNTGFKRGIKNNEDMDRWFLFIFTTEEINVSLIM